MQKYMPTLMCRRSFTSTTDWASLTVTTLLLHAVMLIGPEYLKMEIQIAREISGLDKPNMIVYGGGEKIKELCTKNNVCMWEQFIRNRIK